MALTLGCFGSVVPHLINLPDVQLVVETKCTNNEPKVRKKKVRTEKWPWLYTDRVVHGYNVAKMMNVEYLQFMC